MQIISYLLMYQLYVFILSNIFGKKLILIWIDFAILGCWSSMRYAFSLVYINAKFCCHFFSNVYHVLNKIGILLIYSQNLDWINK